MAGQSRDGRGRYHRGWESDSVFFQKEIETMKPVSYTHLDVYKRQLRQLGFHFYFRQGQRSQPLFFNLGDDLVHIQTGKQNFRGFRHLVSTGIQAGFVKILPGPGLSVQLPENVLAGRCV